MKTGLSDVGHFNNKIKKKKKNGRFTLYHKVFEIQLQYE